MIVLSSLKILIIQRIWQALPAKASADDTVLTKLLRYPTFAKDSFTMAGAQVPVVAPASKKTITSLLHLLACRKK